MLTQEEQHSVDELLGNTSVHLTYRRGNKESDNANALLAFARHLSAHTRGRISVLERDGDTPFGDPCLSIGDRIHYMATPEGAEFLPFIEALSQCDMPREEESDLAPAEVLVFTASGCPHCPSAVRTGIDLALRSPRVSCIVADVQRNQTLTNRFKVRSVPLTLLDRGMSWTGILSTKDMAEKLRSREAPEFLVELLRSLLMSARLDEAVSMVLDRDGKAPFSSVWQNSTTQLRIPMMLVVEEVLERSPRTLDGIIETLGRAVFSEDAALRGDTADLLGQIGHPDGASFVETLLTDSNPDVAELAEEILDSLRKPVTD